VAALHQGTLKRAIPRVFAFAVCTASSGGQGTKDFDSTCAFSSTWWQLEGARGAQAVNAMPFVLQYVANQATGTAAGVR
jgi:hypothetical protein